MKISARNQLKGKVVNIQTGSVNAIVTLDIGGDNHVNATISLDAVKELNLSVGSDAYAIVKATSVMIGIDE
jgi:molybdopterin-binding protein